MSDKVCLNGRMVGASRARISVLDYGLLYGYGLFETMRAYSGVVFRLDDHIARLAGSAKEIGIDVGGMLRTFEESVHKTLRANGRADAYVRLTVTYGAGRPGINLKERAKPSFFIITDNLPDYAEYYRSGVKLTVCETVRQSRLSHTPRNKTLNYLDRVVARREAAGGGFFDALILDEGGFIAEATTSNFFMVEGDAIVTPPKDSILPGITRDTVMGIAGRMGYATVEERISLEKLLEADEIFLTNSIAEILPVAGIGCKSIGAGRQGAVTKGIRQEYKKVVGGYVKERRI